MRNAKIICTLGPASERLRVIEDLAEAGMSVARINASHGDRDALRTLLERVREVSTRTQPPLATMLDLQGPEIRTAPLDAPISLATGSTVTFVPDDTSTPSQIGVSRSIHAVSPGDKILIDDGRIASTVTHIEGNAVTAEIETGGELAGRQGVNIPGVDLDLDMVTDKDRRDLELAGEGLVDFVAASFVSDADDIFEVNAAIEEAGANVPVIAKIERAEAVANMDELIDAAGAVMVARGDLGVECPMEDVPIIQKQLIRRSHNKGVPVVTATEMLDSMIHAARPTRAEASDVANAVLDGTDAVMLSAETAVGDHPVKVVETMDRIITQAERSDEYAELREQRVPQSTRHRTDALARSGRYLVRDMGARAIIAVSETGYTALKTAKFRPAVPIVSVTLTESITRQLALSWGIHPVLVDETNQSVSDVIERGIQVAVDESLVESGDTVVVLVGMLRRLEGTGMSNTLKIHVAAESIATGRVVLSGRVSGPIYEVPDGNIRDVPEGALVYLPPTFDGEFDGDVGRLAGIISAKPGLTGYAALIARELDIPMISGATLNGEITDAAEVTLDAERGVLFEGEITAETERTAFRGDVSTQ